MCYHTETVANVTTVNINSHTLYFSQYQIDKCTKNIIIGHTMLSKHYFCDKAAVLCKTLK